VNSALEFRDSTLAAITVSGGDVTLVLRPGYLHMSDGQPGIDDGTGWHLDLDLKFKDGSTDGLPTGLPLDISDGSLRIGTSTFSLLPFPLPAGEAELALILETGEQVVVRGTALTSTPRREPQYVEKVPRLGRG